ncbi:MAG: hypothetical protein HY944_06360 [Gemmatimonadetes bacterium]|nr:hypothetical protein [Gemmatimonadota bacterium]
MLLRRKHLRSSCLLAFVATAACDLPVVVHTPPAETPPAHLRLHVVDWGQDLNGSEIYLTPNDSLRLRAVVENRPDVYGTPVISASDPTILELLSDGTYNVRHFGTLELTATALAKAPQVQPQRLTATAKINLVCTAEMRPGIVLTVRDSLSGALVPSLGTRRIRAASATRVDSIVVSPTGSLVLGGGAYPAGEGLWAFAMESAGVWSVDVEADGYRAWRGEGIAVSRGVCHVITVRVTARLRPL